MRTTGRSTGMEIVYDGACPFCSAWVRMVRLRERVGPVELIDARSDDPRPAALARAGYDLDRGMIVRWQGRVYHGDAAMHLLAVHSGPGGVANSVQRRIFASPALSAAFYPVLVRGRRLVLRLMRRRPIGGSKENPPERE